MDMPNNCMGICITCKHRSYCLSFQNGLRAERPIWDCNEYEHNDVEVDAVSQEYCAPAENDESLSNEINRENKKGLCINCNSRDSCMLPRPESGIWHCEEYC
jgi:hypothetical protein